MFRLPVRSVEHVAGKVAEGQLTCLYLGESGDSLSCYEYQHGLGKFKNVRFFK